ncbi:nucleotidyltransferase domain-containing protein [Leekyejoonella antrihumi]|uniref:Aminoglycoside adenylyltransferase n=1 Tax=Leekyejoonella antrihumi TaxID=1660198 RepID=A0A563DPA4_9MICO|nr:aminoglycoside adenylyltransferase [Leekyejoonella antrihumi]TWP31773.1 aminoglycoside adenylyltransferase [Leekyejoonella antrihumi]
MVSLAREQLAAVAEVLGAGRRGGIEIWLRGGWAMDFYLGEISREHLDVDFFAWRHDLPQLVESLVANGWSEIGTHPRDQQRDLRRGAVELGFAPLERDVEGRVVVGGGPWRGTRWPADILSDAVVGHIGDLCCPVISPRAQVEIKQMMPEWVPAMRRRPKPRSVEGLG